MSDAEKVLLLKDLFDLYKNTLNLTTAEMHEIEMVLEKELSEAAVNEVREMKKERRKND